MRLKRSDQVIISITCFFLGLFLMIQYYSSTEYKKLVQPENNEVIVLEVAKQTKVNADLRREVSDLTNDLNTYSSISSSNQSAYDKFQSDTHRLAIINGTLATSGQGVILKIDGSLTTPQVIDLINALKNIGAEVISINGDRLTLYQDLGDKSGFPAYEIRVLGNSSLLKSALERSGGVVDLISSKSVTVSIVPTENITIGAAKLPSLTYSKIIEGK